MTKQQHSPTAVPAAIEEQHVVEFLRAQPEFFTNHPDVLMDMTLHHSSGTAISLIERQVVNLREHNRHLKSQLHDLVKIARDNDRLSERMHRLVLSLMDCTTLQDVFIGIYESLRNDFQADAVVMRLMAKPKVTLNDAATDAVQDVQVSREAGMPEATNGVLFVDPFLDHGDVAWDAFKGFLKNAKPVCGHLGATQMNTLFGDQASSVASAALIPLCGIPGSTTGAGQLHIRAAGIVAVGSHDTERFHHGMGTHFLSQMGEIISCAVRPYLATE